jgi:hypothetical protein
MRNVATEMPPINMLDPIMWQWLNRISPKITKDGETICLPVTHWPNGEPVTYIGLMADEVEKVDPDAVSEINGIKHVDYAKAVQLPVNVWSFSYDSNAISGLMKAEQ